MTRGRRVPKPRSVSEIRKDRAREDERTRTAADRAFQRMMRRFKGRNERRLDADRRRKRNPPGIRRIRPDIPINKFFRDTPTIQLARVVGRKPRVSASRAARSTARRRRRLS